MIATPTTLAELVVYLLAHPLVRSDCADPRIKPEPRLRFSRAGDGGLWFERPDGTTQYVPINCGLTAAESGVTFRPDGFDLEKFNITVRFTYLEGDE